MKKMTGALSRYRTKSDLVYEALRQAILAGRFQPGTRINIDQLVLELGTSKVPIREAIGRLVGEGWLQMNPHVGAMVPELSADEIVETSIIRSVIEGAAIRFSASRLSQADLAKLRTLVTRMDAAVATEEDAHEYPQLNLEFHAAAIETCPFLSLKALANSFLEKTRRLRTVHFLPNYLAESQQEHWELLRALERRDARTAERITRHHVEHAGHLLSQFAQARIKDSAGKNGAAEVSRSNSKPRSRAKTRRI